MPELRRDPVVGRWVIINTERAKRPSALLSHIDDSQKHDEVDPFAGGNEHMTPPEVLAYRPAGSKPDSEGWWVRVVPNKFAALDRHAGGRRSGVGMYDIMEGLGQHEVVVETPKPGVQLSDMEDEQVQEVIWAFRDRSVHLRKDPRFRYTLIFKNYGRDAGASIWHAHSQIIALPIVPKSVQEELEGAKKYYDYKERCVYCDMIAQELAEQKRIVMENDQFVAFCPYASRFPFETWILPRAHENFFSDVTRSNVLELAKILKGTLRKMKLALDDPAYNLIFHTTPYNSGSTPYYHWHIEILPSLSKVAGFEWGTGFFINPVPPEDAAEYLRTAEVARATAGSNSQ